MLIIIVILLFLLVSIEAYIALRKKLSTTPYDISLLRKRRNWFAFGRKKYDFFISYKSEDVSKAREICETLIVNRRNVWFDEYTILLTGREDFKQALLDGISESKFGVCLTNLGYSMSEYCREELQTMLKIENCGPKNIIEIGYPTKLSPSHTFPALSQSFSFQYKNLKETLKLIQKATGFRLHLNKKDTVEEPEKHTFFYQNISYSIQLVGWDLSEYSFKHSNSLNGYGPHFYRKGKKTDIWGHLSVQEKPVSIRNITTSKIRQKAYLEDLIKSARSMYSTTSDKRCYGVHLVQLNGFGHVAFTIYKEPGIWVRKYDIVLPLRGKDKDIKFQFEFSYRGHFRGFCGTTADFDKVVLSLNCQSCLVND
jgi:hypothetical protein